MMNLLHAILQKKVLKLNVGVLFLVIYAHTAEGQTNPTAHNLSSGNFSFTGFGSGTTTTYPTSMQGHKFPSERTTSNLTGNADGDRVLVDSTNSITSGSIRNESSNGISLLNSGTNHIGAIVVSVNSTNRENLTVSWTAQQLNSGGSGGTDRINGLRLQYRIGTSGSFTDVSSTEYLTNQSTSQNAAQSFSNISLPTACDDEAIVHVRFVYYVSSGTTNSRDRIRLDDITISSSAISSTSPSITLSSPSATNTDITEGLTNQVLYRFDLAITTATATLTGVSLSTSGTYIASDISNLKCWYSADNSFSSSTDALLSTK